MTSAILRLRRMSPLANACRWYSRTFLRILPYHSLHCPTSPRRGLYGNSPPESLLGQCGVPFPHPASATAEGAQLNVSPFPATASAEGRQLNVAPSLWERARGRVPAVSPIYGCGSTLATT